MEVSMGSFLTSSWRLEKFLYSQAVWIDWPADQSKVDLTTPLRTEKSNDRSNGQDILVMRYKQVSSKIGNIYPWGLGHLYWSFIQMIARPWLECEDMWMEAHTHELQMEISLTSYSSIKDHPKMTYLSTKQPTSD